MLARTDARRRLHDWSKGKATSDPSQLCTVQMENGEEMDNTRRRENID